ncbi:TIGR03118 family protein [Aquisphaera insulae]|uniref:TIGR03118 family protein n=1 Tax=Aquisphaera insulae TaxID=2712864 RepID=UPI0013EC2DB1|nr:TIGR03118 family protein [Aquisphaera insulae]
MRHAESPWRWRFEFPALVTIAIVSAFGPVPLAARAGSYIQTNLVSDIPGMALTTDPNLKNPWGISSFTGGPFWVSNQGTSTSTLYTGDGTARPLVVTTPTIVGGPNGPTGQVFNTSNDFVLANGGKALFLFADLNGTISGWNPTAGTVAQIGVSPSGAVYTGLALATNGGSSFLYAADARNNKIDVFNGTFGATSLAGSFTDPNLPSGFTVYNIQNIGGKLFVTYENEATGGGVINEFDLNGNLIKRLTSNTDGGPLDSPWGMALAPKSFGQFGGDLLVGNEEDGHISAFDPTTGAYLGQLTGPDGKPIANTGLWGLAFGTGGLNGDPNTLYFAAGIDDERHGLFGAISVIPEPSSIALALIAAATLAARRRFGRRVASRP